MSTIVSQLKAHARHVPHSNAYLFLKDGLNQTDSLTYAQLDESASATATFLLKNISRQERVILLYPPGLDFISAFFGCLYAGVIAVPVYCPLLKDFASIKEWLNTVIKNANISSILTTESYVEVLQENFLTNNKILIYATNALNENPIESVTPVIQSDDIAFLQYSSGSTAAPKAVIIRHKNLFHNLKSSTQAWKYSKYSKTLTWAPHTHIYGLVCGLLAPLYYGTPSFIIPPEVFIRRPLVWLEAISQYKISHSGGPNFAYDLCNEEIKHNKYFDKIDLSSWKVAINGGENVQASTLDQFTKNFSRFGFLRKYFCSAYGMSELSGTIAVSRYGKEPLEFYLDPQHLNHQQIVFTNSNKPSRRFVSNGRLIGGIKAIIIDPNTLDLLSKNQIGEICLAGNSLTSGYWQTPEEASQSFIKFPHSDETFFRTGDLGFIYKKEICLTGRLKDVIVVYGKKYLPLDLEMAVASQLNLFPVTSARVVFSLNQNGREEVIFLQEVEESLTLNQKNEVVNIIRRVIAKEYGINLKAVLLVKEGGLPRTTSGKLQRKLVQQYFMENRLDVLKMQPSKVLETSRSHLLASQSNEIQRFIETAASALKIQFDKINLAAPLSEYHLDSISITRLITTLNNEFKLSMSPAELFEYATLGNLSKHVLEHIKNTDDNHSVLHKQKSEGVHHGEDIAIIGMNGIFPDAPDIATFWDHLIKGKDAIKEIPVSRWDWTEYEVNRENENKIKWGGFVDSIGEFDAAFFNISPREAELTDPQQRLFLQVVWRTIEDAGYTPATLAKLNAGLFVGVFNHDYAELLQANEINDAYTTTGTTNALLANRVSYMLNFRGPSEAIDTACSSSLVAIHNAVNAIHNGDCQVAIAGGVNALLSPNAYLAANNAGMLSEDGKCKTFDKKANGYVRAEGAGAILLKPLKQAQLDGDHIYGVIKGTAVNHGGHVSSLTVPNPVAQAEVIAMACQRADIPVNTISYIETHGTGTPLGDPIEINGLKKAFQMIAEAQKIELSTKAFCGLGSVKTHVGHLEAAAGMASVIKVLLAMQHRKLPKNLHFEELNPYIEIKNSPFYIVDKNLPWNPSQDTLGHEIPLRAGISSFGFGGTNAHIILEENRFANTETTNNSPAYLIPLSAKTTTALYQQLQQLDEWLQAQSHAPSLASISYTLSIGRTHFAKRCIMMVTSINELKETLALAKQNHSAKNFIINSDDTPSEQIKPIFNELFKGLVKELTSDVSLPPDEYRNKLLALGSFYTLGSNIEWELLFKEKKQRISMPTYPFAKDYFWIPISQNLTSTEQYDPNLSVLARVQQNFLDKVSTILRLPIQHIGLTIPLNELGFDSIAYKELATQLEKTYQIEINPSVFFTHLTVEALSQYLVEHFEEQINQFFSMLVRPKEKAPIKKISTSKSDPIAIIGMHAYLPKSKDLNEFWQHLEAGHDLVSEIPIERWDWQPYFGDIKKDATKTNSKWGACLADVDKFDASFFNISAREAKLMDPQHRLFMEVVWHTIEDAGINPNDLSEKEIGVFAGVEFNEYQNLIHQYARDFHGHVATGTSHAMLANRVSYFLNLQGPSEVIDTACSSSLVAIHRAIHAIRNGECTMAIAGGVSLMLNPDTFVITSQLGALSSDGRCKTFDKSANGYVKGEGVASVLLKPLSQAQKDGNYIYGIVKGSAVNHGGKAQSLTAPNALTQSKLLKRAYAEAGVELETMSYIETHGTGTELGDPIEIEGLKQAFQAVNTQHTYCGLGSVKTNIGHLEPASGVVGLIKVLLAMEHGKLPGLLHFNQINPYIDLTNSPFYLVDETTKWFKLKDKQGKEIPRRAGVSSFGFGGTCAHLIVEEASHISEKIHTQHKSFYLVTLSAKEKQSLSHKISDLHDWLKINFSKITLEALSYTLNIGKAHFKYRCAIVVNSLEELLTTLQNLMSSQTTLNSRLSTDRSENFDNVAMYRDALSHIQKYATTDASIYREKLFKVAEYYVSGQEIQWEILHLDENPRRISGLPAYPFLKQRYWFDQTTVVPQPLSENKVIEMDVLTYLKNLFGKKLQIAPENIDEEATYEVYGLDSLIGIEITNQLEQDFGSISKTILFEKSTLNELAEYLKQKYSPKQVKVAQEIQTQPVPIKTELTSEKNQLTQDDIAIIGLNGIFPLANNLDEFWNNLISGRDCITEVPKDRWDYQDYPVKVGGEEKYFKHGGFIADVDKFDALFFGVAPREAALMDPQERIFLQSAWMALEDSAYNKDRLQSRIQNRLGVFAGVTYNFYPMFVADEWNKGNRLPLDIQTFSIANRVSYFLNAKGPSLVIDTACSSSLSAVHLACESIQRGECEMAIAGGVNLSLHPTKYHFLGSYSFMSDQGRCASFGEGGGGYVPGEGVGAIVLKPLSLAIRDKDHIYAVIKATSINHGGKTSGYTVPNPIAQGELITQTLEKANVNARSISYVEAHGTGTTLGDPIEIKGLQQAFERQTDVKQFCAIGSVKSNIGHLESAAGMSQIAKVLLQLKHKKIVPSLHSEKLNPLIEFKQTPFYVQQKLTDWTTSENALRRAAISSFGAGGTNVHLILEEFTLPTQNIISKPFIFVLSAFNADRLQIAIEQMVAFIHLEKTHFTEGEALDNWLTKLCYTLQVGREPLTARFAVLGNTGTELLEKLTQYVKTPTQTIKDIWVNHSATHKKMNLNLQDVLREKELSKIVDEWIEGAKIPWDDLYAEQPTTISLPNYPFEKRRCWVPTQDKSPTTIPIKQTAINSSVILSNEQEKNENWLYTTQWEKSSDISINPSLDSNDQWLIFCDKEIGYILCDEFKNDKTIVCFKGEQFQQFKENVIYLNPEDPKDYDALFSSLHENSSANLKGIIYLWPLSIENQNFQAGKHLLYLLQSLIKYQWQNKLIFTFVSRESQSVTQKEAIQIWQHHLWSLTRIFAAEQGNYQILLLDLDTEKNISAESAIIKNELTHYQPSSNHIAYRNNQRYQLNLLPYILPEKNIPEKSSILPIPRCALITGGLGALGTEVAKWLVEQGTQYLLLIGSSKLPDRSTWPEITDLGMREKLDNFILLEKLNIQMRYIEADVSHAAQMQAAVTQVELEWKTSIDGVFHLAGITTDGITIDKLAPDLFEKVLAVKVKGALVLHEIFSERQLDCFILFSSIAALPFFGMSGLSAYSAANEFLNGLALMRRQQGLSALSINWAAWAEKGMSHRYNHSRFLDAVGMATISIKKGIEILSHLLTYPNANVTVFKINWEKFFKVNVAAKKLSFFTHFAMQSEDVKKPFSQLTAEQINQKVLADLGEILQLEPNAIDPTAPYSNFGLDSIIGINFVAKLNETFHDIISPMDLYRYPTIYQLSQYIIQNYAPNDKQSGQDSELTEEEISQMIEKEIADLDGLDS